MDGIGVIISQFLCHDRDWSQQLINTMGYKSNIHTNRNSSYKFVKKKKKTLNHEYESI